MFDFEQFPVYQKVKEFNIDIQPILKNNFISFDIKSQLKRAASSILLNIAEGAGKFNKKDKRKFYLIARGSAQECVAILQVLEIEDKIKKESFANFYSNLTEISKMLSGLVKSMS